MIDNKLGTIISKLRKEKGLTQKDLADALNISDKAISRWETGNSSPNMDMLLRISKFFNVPLNDLITARVSEDEDDGIVQEIIQEFTEMNKKNSKRIKIVLLSALIIVLILLITIIFTQSFNRFKVYKVDIENSEIYPIEGVYVETRIKDTLNLGNIKIKGYEPKESDTISVNLYYKENDKEYVLQSYSSLNNLNFVTYQSYIKIDDLSNYSDKMYIKIIIIDSKGNSKEYNAKLNFILDFSNNKIFYTDDNNSIENNKTINISVDEIKIILLNNGFEETTNNVLWKNNGKYLINYVISSNKISVNYEKNNLNYRYAYILNNDILEVSVFDENNTVIENYKYDVANNKRLECITGKCNSYKEAIKILNENIINLLRNK